jgi:hypothetical protein
MNITVFGSGKVRVSVRQNRCNFLHLSGSVETWTLPKVRNKVGFGNKTGYKKDKSVAYLQLTVAIVVDLRLLIIRLSQVRVQVGPPLIPLVFHLVTTTLLAFCWHK